LMMQARGAAFVIIEQDPKLEEPRHEIFQALLQTIPTENLSQVS